MTVCPISALPQCWLKWVRAFSCSVYAIKAMVQPCLIPRAKKIDPEGHAIDKVIYCLSELGVGILAKSKYPS